MQCRVQYLVWHSDEQSYPWPSNQSSHTMQMAASQSTEERHPLLASRLRLLGERAEAAATGARLVGLTVGITMPLNGRCLCSTQKGSSSVTHEDTPASNSLSLRRQAESTASTAGRCVQLQNVAQGITKCTGKGFLQMEL